MPGNPLIWLAVIGFLAGPCTYGVMKIQEWRQWRVAYEQGIDAGKGQSASATVAGAAQTAQAERAAEEETPLSPDKAALVELCKRSAACRERGIIK